MTYRGLLGLIFGILLGAVIAASLCHAQGTEYGSDLEISRLKPTDLAILVTLVAPHELQASKVKVGHVADGKPLLCFKDPDKQLVGCFVLNVKTGQVVYLNLPTDEVSI